MDERSESEILDAAADLIEPEGRWTQEKYARSEDGRGSPLDAGICFCVVGAIAAVMGVEAWQAETSEPVSVLAQTLGFTDEDPGADVECWNDAPDRTQAEVVAALRKAAQLAKATGSDPQAAGVGSQ